ncbi:MAG: hypothetical protein H7A33_05495 [Deltaproteobacteria bacterium]|nr:hypothetical protein [Deltaproteobacteria bacterium]
MSDIGLASTDDFVTLGENFQAYLFEEETYFDSKGLSLTTGAQCASENGMWKCSGDALRYALRSATEQITDETFGGSGILSKQFSDNVQQVMAKQMALELGVELPVQQPTWEESVNQFCSELMSHKETEWSLDGPKEKTVVAEGGAHFVYIDVWKVGNESRLVQCEYNKPQQSAKLVKIPEQKIFDSKASGFSVSQGQRIENCDFIVCQTYDESNLLPDGRLEVLGLRDVSL